MLQDNLDLKFLMRDFLEKQGPPSENVLGALKSKGGAKIRNCQVKYLTKYVKSSLSTDSKW